MAEYGVLLVTGGMTHQENYGPGFSADPRARVVAVADEPDVDARRRRLNQQFAEEMGVSYIPNLDDALGRPDVHAVSVCPEFERRARVGALCARAGKHVYLDKPLATTREDARALVEAVRAAGVRSQMFTQVGQPYAQRAKQIVVSGQLGELQAIHCDMMFAKGHPGSADLGKPRKEHYPPRQFTFPDAKREVWTTAVYSLSLIRWLTRREFTSVFATTANYFFAEHQSRDIEDFGVLMLTLEGGLTATLTAARIGWRSHKSSGPNLTRLYGTQGSAMIDAHGPKFVFASASDDWVAPTRDPEDPMGFWRSTQVRASIPPKPDWQEPAFIQPLSDQAMFLDAIELDQEAQVTAFDGAAATDALLGAYESAASGRVVELRGV